MSELVEFIRGCLDADEQTARAALAPAEMFPYGDESLTPFTREQVPDAVRGYLGGTWGAHIARHDPARVLAEVNAKRAILHAAFSVAATIDAEYGCCHTADDLRAGGRMPEFDGDEFEPLPDRCLGPEVVERFARPLAQCFRGEPGWRDEWGTQ